MICLMIIAETKNTFSAFQLFHQHYWYNNSGKSKKQYEPVTRTGRNYGNLLLHCYVLYEKTIVAGRKQPM